MSDQYEEVPISDLQDHQVYFINEEKEPGSWEGGAAAVAAKGLYKGAPIAVNAVKERLRGKLGTPEPQGSVTVQGAPEVLPTKPIPSTVGEFHAPQMVTEHGFGPGAVKNALHNVDQAVANPVYSNVAANPEQGFELKGNSRILTPEGTYPLPPSAPPPSAPAGAPFAGSAPAPEPLTATQRAMQTIQGMGAKAEPFLRTADPYLRAAGLFGAGTTGMEAMKRFNHNDYGRGIIDLIGTAGATAASLPVKTPWTTIGGAGVALGAHGLNKLLDEYYGREYATGGLVHLK